MEKNKKPVCLHFHIFKNAGMTISWILEKNFGKNHVRMDVDIVDEVLPIDVIIDYLSKFPDVKAFSSHLIKFPVPENIDFQIIPILFIRNPLDRIFSIYHYNRTISTDNSQGSRQAKSLSLSEYLEWELQQKKRMNAKNFQTIYLSDKDNKSHATISDLETAIKRLKTIPVLGVVDRFDESVVYAEEVLRPNFPNIDLSYARQNVSSNKNLSISEKLKAAGLEIDEELMNKLINKNELDLKLYSEANKKLDSRIREVADFETKLSQFKERCQIIQKNIPKSDQVFKHPRLYTKITSTNCTRNFS